MPRYIDLDELLKYPIRIDHYDKEHGDTNFVHGIESVIEYAEHLPIYEVLPTEPDDIVVMSITRNTLTYEETRRCFNSLKEAIPNKVICVMDDVKIGVKKNKGITLDESVVFDLTLITGEGAYEQEN